LGSSAQSPELFPASLFALGSARSGMKLKLTIPDEDRQNECPINFRPLGRALFFSFWQILESTQRYTWTPSSARRLGPKAPARSRSKRAAARFPRWSKDSFSIPFLLSLLFPGHRLTALPDRGGEAVREADSFAQRPRGRLCAEAEPCKTRQFFYGTTSLDTPRKSIGLPPNTNFAWICNWSFVNCAPNL